MTHSALDCEVVVVGGGPAGATVARLLADRGHAVTVVARCIDERRGLAESLPPSTRKVLAAVGALEAVDRSGAMRSVGNIVWWGGGDGRVENFGGGAGATGHQVWRPAFDRLLAQRACEGGVVWKTGNVHDVSIGADHVETQFVTPDGAADRLASAFVIDASGRSAVLTKHARRPIPNRRTLAWMGRWDRFASATTGDDTRTLVETTDDGWVWSVPLDVASRCVTVMIDPDRTRFASSGTLESRYLGELRKATNVWRLVESASLRDVWGCDASLYDSVDSAGPRHLAVGDASAFIDPLSSFGVKKALTSAWMGAAVVHTCLTEPALGLAARDLFVSREREAYVSSVRQTTAYAREAFVQHDSPFWRSRAVLPGGIEEPAESDAIADGPAVARAFAALREQPQIDLRPSPSVRFEWQAVFQGHRVALERAVAARTLDRPVRFVDSVDVLRLVEMAAHYRQVGEFFDGYCRIAAPVPLPNFLKALSVLVARRVLEPAGC